MLEISRISHSFGGLQALHDVSLVLRPGEIMGLIGPNGSGKSTLLNIISGIYPPDAGSLLFEGQEIAGHSLHRIAKSGIARTFQTPRLYQRMTVRDNLEAARTAISAPRGDSIDEALAPDTLLEMAGLTASAHTRADRLSLPEQRRLELIRTQTTNPKLVLLDEPAGGMTPAETMEVAQLIKALVRPGQSWIVIEHKMDLIGALCERVAVLDFGRVIADGDRRQVFADPAVIEAYLGSEEAG